MFADVDALAVRQLGLVTRRQMLDVMSRPQLRGLIDKGLLTPISRGVYRTVGTPLTWEQRVFAAVLSRDGAAAASHRCAARLWGIRGAERWPVVEITVERGRSARSGEAQVHSSTLLAEEVRRVRGIPVTHVARTLLDLSTLLPEVRLGIALDDCLQRRLITRSELSEFLNKQARSRPPGLVRFRAVVATRATEDGPVVSALQQEAARCLVRAGFTGFVQEYRITTANGVRYADIAWPDAKVIVEVDGYAEHGKRHSFDDDRRRINELVAGGWIILHFTATTDEIEFAEHVKTALHVRRRRIA